MPGQATTQAAAQGYGGGSGSASTCNTFTSYYTTSGWSAYPTTIAKIESVPYTATYTTYKTINTYGESGDLFAWKTCTDYA
jgi:hypothetical protein